MGVVEILAIWFGLSLTGALAPGPLSAAVVMQASRRDKLHGILPMLGHAIVELGIMTAIILSVQALTLDPLTIDLLIGFGGIVIVGFGLLALKDYKHSSQEEKEQLSSETSIGTLMEATTQGAIVSILSPYFLLWWFGVGLSNVTILMTELQVGVGTVFIAGVLFYITHISTDFLFGAFLAVGSDEASKRATAGDINWVNVGIGVFQAVLGLWFIIQALTPV
ncbi:MAG: LysE family transporter [Candidatus Thorarchaeota archaeon]|jgi:threonine/homoserine/homoserine lactone efflux protein